VPFLGAEVLDKQGRAGHCKEAAKWWNCFRRGLVERVLPEWSGAKNILHLVYPTPRGMLPSVRSLIDYLLIHVSAWLQERSI
jgi:hypothetical protein